MGSGGAGGRAQASPSLSPDNPTAVVPRSTASPTAVPPTPETGGTVIVALPREPDTLAFMQTAMPEARWILSTTDVPMITAQADGTYRPTLLVDVPTYGNGLISPDGLTYTVRFEADRLWSDGEPIDARDLRFTWRAVTIQGRTVSGPHTAYLETGANTIPRSSFPGLVSGTYYIVFSSGNQQRTIQITVP